MFHAQVRLYAPEAYDAAGNMTVDPADLAWHQIPYLEPDQCEHGETMCRECSGTWQKDWEVIFPALT